MKEIENVREYILNGETKAALELLLSVLDGALKDQALLLASRLETISRKEREGTLSPEKISRERNRINKAILEISFQAAQPPPVFTWWERHRRWLWVGVLIAFGLLIVVTAFLPKKGFYGKLMVVCDRVSFRYLQGGNLTDQQPLKEMKVQNFEEIVIQADKLWLDTDGDGRLFETEVKLAEPLVTLYPIPEIGGSEISVSPVSLSILDYSKGALLTFSLTKDKPDELQLDIQQSESTTAECFFQDSITFFAAYVRAAGWDDEPDNLAGKVYGSSARKVFVTGNADATVLYLQFADSLSVASRDMKVTDLDFSKKDAERQVSSILQATIQLTDTEEQAYKTIQLAPGENLLLSTVKQLALTRILINSKGIQLSLQGNIHALRTGTESGLQNPSVLEWLWHSHRLLLLLFGGLVLLGSYFSKKIQ